MIIRRDIRRVWRRFRSAITGRFVSKRYADKHPDTTVAETIEWGRDYMKSRYGNEDD